METCVLVMAGNVRMTVVGSSKQVAGQLRDKVGEFVRLHRKDPYADEPGVELFVNPQAVLYVETEA